MSKRPGIDVAVVLFYKPGKIPAQINLQEGKLPLLRSIRGFTTGLSGHQQLDGLMHAHQYADANGLEIIVIDLLVGFTLPIYPKTLPSELVKDHDVLSLFRVSKSLIADIASYWKEWILKEEGVKAEHQYDWSRPADFVARRPDLLPRLLKLKQFSHINLVTHPVMTSFSDRALTATSFRVGYPHIKSASSRFHPGMEILY